MTDTHQHADCDPETCMAAPAPVDPRCSCIPGEPSPGCALAGHRLVAELLARRSVPSPT